MSSFFKSEDAFDPASFNYNTASDKVKRKRAFADALMRTEQPKGQMVPGGPNGFYVAPSMGEHLSAGLQKILGAYLQSKADDSQATVDKNSQEAFSHQLGLMNGGVKTTPTDEPRIPAQAESLPVEDIEQIAQPNPVRKLEATKLGPLDSPTPPASISPNVMQSAAQVLTGAGGGRGSVNPPLVNTENPGTVKDASGLEWKAGESIMGRAKRRAVDALKGAFGPAQEPDTRPEQQVIGDTPTPQALPPMPAQQAPLPQQQAPQLPPQMTEARAPQALPPMPQQPLMPNINAPAQQAPAPQPQQAQPSIGEQIQRLTQIANTGPSGQQYAQMMLAQMSQKSNDFKVELSRDPTSGELAVVRVNGRTGDVEILNGGARQGGEKVLETKDTPNGIIERTASGWRPAQMNGEPIVGDKQQEKLNLTADKVKEAEGLITQGEELKRTLNALTEIDPKTGKPVIDSTAGISGAVSLGYNAVTRQPTAASQADAKVQGLKSQIFAYGMARLKSAGGGAGAANSDAEGKRLEMALGNLDIAKLGTEGFTREANKIIASIEENANRIDRSVQARGGSLQTRQPGAAPVPMSYSAFTGGR